MAREFRRFVSWMSPLARIASVGVLLLAAALTPIPIRAQEIDGALTITKEAGGYTNACWPPQVGAVYYQLAQSPSPAFSPPCTTTITAATCWGDPEVPAVGEAFFYLVRTAVPLGSWGNRSDGQARFPDCQDGASAALVVNEVDYDQPSADLTEFIELYNVSTRPVSLDRIAVVLVNGATNAEYSRVTLSGALPPGSYALLHAAALPPTGALNFLFPLAQDNVQNGAPDGIALIRTDDATLVDALSYEGTITSVFIDGWLYNLVEGTPTSAADSGASTGSLVRLPNGQDTDNAVADWFFSSTPTPASANVP